MSKYISVVGCELSFKNPLASGLITITPPSSPTSCSSSKNKIYAGQLNFTVSGYTVGSFVQSTPVQGSIQGTAAFATADGQPLLLEGDSSTVLTIPGMIGQTSTTVTDTVYIKSAGQKVVKAT